MTQTSRGQESVNALYLFKIMLRSWYVIDLIDITATEEAFAYLLINKHQDNFTVHQFKAAIKHHWWIDSGVHKSHIQAIQAGEETELLYAVMLIHVSALIHYFSRSESLFYVVPNYIAIFSSKDSFKFISETLGFCSICAFWSRKKAKISPKARRKPQLSFLLLTSLGYTKLVNHCCRKSWLSPPRWGQNSYYTFLIPSRETANIFLIWQLFSGSIVCQEIHLELECAKTETNSVF